MKGKPQKKKRENCLFGLQNSVLLTLQSSYTMFHGYTTYRTQAFIITDYIH